MLKTRTLLLLLTLPMLLVGASMLIPTDAEGQTATKVPLIPAASCDLLNIEPVLLKETSGYSLGGAVHDRFAVYANGLVSMSKMSGGVFNPKTSSADFIFVSPQDVKQLLRALVKAGALTLCDQAMIVADIPPTAITVFRGGMDARAHSFSYYIGFNEYEGVTTVLNDFKQKHFPNF